MISIGKNAKLQAKEKPMAYPFLELPGMVPYNAI